MIENSVYNEKFYENRGVIFDSANAIIPHLLQLVDVKSVIDVGCGPGEWLSTFRQHGVTDIVGYDGEWVDKSTLHFPRELFVTADLKKPIQLSRKFDLAISLEVAEHLPESVAKQFVASIAASAPAVLFSAAIPLQGGAYHINEQWPAYWSALFGEHGFVAVDCIREKVWDNPSVGWWYAQNCMLLVKPELIEKNELLAEYNSKSKGKVPALIHPRLFTYYVKRHNRLIDLIPRPAKWLYRKFIKQNV
jgi:SAM-dependent methyltransferase